MTKQEFTEQFKSSYVEAEIYYNQRKTEIPAEELFLEIMGTGGFKKFHMTQIVLSALGKPLMRPDIKNLLNKGLPFKKWEREFESMAQYQLLFVLDWALDEKQ